MKKIMVIVLVVFSASIMQAQDKNKKISFEVDGVCEMCKKRIEKAAVGVKGVKYAVWDMQSHELSLIYDERKTDPMQIKTAIVLVGHDTKELKASEEAYNKVHPCCRYREKINESDHHQ